MKIVFTGVSTASRALGLSNEDGQRDVPRAEPDAWKGKNYGGGLASAIRRALAGRNAIAAKALGVTTQEFARMLDAGQLTLDLVAEVREVHFKEQLGEAADAGGHRGWRGR